MKSPKSIYNKLSESIAGNEAAKKAASLILFNTISGRRSCSLFTGPTGSGKTEIFRELKQMFPETVFIADATYLSPEGWNTSTGTHIADIHPPNQIVKKILHITAIYFITVRKTGGRAAALSRNNAPLVHPSYPLAFKAYT